MDSDPAMELLRLGFDLERRLPPADADIVNRLLGLAVYSRQVGGEALLELLDYDPQWRHSTSVPN